MNRDPASPSVREIVERCLELPVEERSAFIERSCAHDPAFARRVRRLVAAAQRAEESGFLDPDTVIEALGESEPVPGGPDASSLIGTKVGRYLIQRMLGSGGMGSVYEAVQDEPQRTVALKIMRGGLFARSAQRRFDYEATILARLRHPCIAQIYDAGAQVVSTGAESHTVRYFAMELVPGARTITAYASSHRLSMTERLRIFSLVCDAVHHGHLKGIIHRDLKPGNILVDESGHVKVIDFGVARMIDSTIATQHTVTGQMVGTLQYMSPEQCGVESADIDIRSDVYSLGLILYELLVEQPPYDVSAVPLHEAARIIREDLPSRRGTASRAMRGDLETITLKALEKDRDRRYESASALRDDLERFLRGDPIAARPATLLYQLRSLTRRHRTFVAGACGVLLALVIALASSMYWLSRVKRERDAARDAQTKANTAARRSDRAAEFLRTVIASASPNLPLPQASLLTSDPLDPAEDSPHTFVGSRLDQFNVPDVLIAAGKRLESEFPDEPLVRADLAETLAITLHQLGFFVPAEELYNSCLRARQRYLGPEDPLTVDVLARIADNASNMGKIGEGATLAGEVFSRTQHLYGPEDRRTLLAHYRWISARMIAGQDYRPLIDELSDMHKDVCNLFGPSDPMALRLQASIGYNRFSIGERDQGETIVRESLAALTESAGPRSMATVQTALALADMLAADQRLAEAETLARDGLQGLRSTYPDASNRVRHAQTLLVGILRRQARYDEAIKLAREMLTVARRVDGVDHHLTIRYEDMLARLLVRAADAAGYSTPGVPSDNRADMPVADETTLTTKSGETVRMQTPVRDLATLGFPDEAERLSEHAARTGESVLSLKDFNAVNYALNHIATVRWRGRPEEAQQLLSALEQRATAAGVNLSTFAGPYFHLIRGDIRVDLGQLVEAEADLRLAYGQLKSVSPEYHARTARSMARLLDRAGKHDEAAQFHEESK